jgi:hypothetical protein
MAIPPTANRKWFALGRIYATAPARRAFTEIELEAAIDRHSANDWGDLGEEDRQLNDQGLDNGDRIFSSYVFPDGRKLWVITEATREQTTALLPEDY